MRKLATLIICLYMAFPLDVWAYTCTSTGTGNWSAAGSWTACNSSTPGIGDTAVIANTHTITVDGTPTVGTQGVTGTAAVTVNTGGTLLIPGTLTIRGDLIQQKGATVTGQAGGKLAFDSISSSRQYGWKVSTGGSGSSLAHATATGTSWGTNSFFTITNGTRGGANGFVDGSNVASYLYAYFDFAYTKFINIGTASKRALDLYANTTGQALRLNHVLFNGCGLVNSSSGATTDNTMTAVDFRGSLAYTLIISSTADLTTGVRTLTDITAYNTAKDHNINLAAPDITVNGISRFNTPILASSSAKRLSITNDFNTGIVVTTSPSFYTSLQPQSTTVYTQSVSLLHYDNQHHVAEAGGAGLGLSANHYSYNVFDGDGHYGTDEGDCFTTSASTTIDHNIAINRAGVLLTGHETQALNTVTNNTVDGALGTGDGAYNTAYGYLVNAGETSFSATALVTVENNLITNLPKGLAQESAFVSQTAFTLDYNDSFNMAVSTNLDYPAGHPLVGTNSYMGIETYPWWSPTQVFGRDNATHDLGVNPNYVDNTRTVRGYFGLGSVTLVGQDIVTKNGFDYTGAAISPTTKTVAGALAYIQAGMTPRAASLLHGGTSSTYIGAVQPVIHSMIHSLFMR